MKLSKVIQSTLIGLLASLTLGFTYAHANESDSDTMVMYYHHDVRGDPVVVTDSSGSILWLENYRAYGASEPRVSSAGIGFGDNAAAESNNRLGYTGHERDGGSGLTYMKARYYDNLTGRFLSNDPVGYTTKNPTQSFNRYMYVNNNPYAYVDPDGRFLFALNSNRKDLTPEQSLQVAGMSNAAFKAGLGGAATLASVATPGPEDIALSAGVFLGLSKVKKASWIADASNEAGSVRNVNPTGGAQNCVNCAIATDATLAGRRAIALPGGPTSISVLEKTFGGKFKSISGQSEISSTLANAGNGARGIVFGARGDGVGHVFNAVNQNGKIRFLDGQAGNPASFDGFSGFQFLRTN